MDGRTEIYNLWVQYTTKNDEYYFRKFVERFVCIWKDQLHLDFSTNPPLWHDVKTDRGPHLSRLPEELLPAIGKFIIVARDESESHKLMEEGIEQTALLIDCLIIVCRHFDNILAVIKYEYKSNLIAIMDNVYKETVTHKRLSGGVVHLFRSFSQFLEVMYDPYLTWRSFMRGQLADFKLLSYKPHAVHVEIIPFIYDCFQCEEMLQLAEIGVPLLHVLGAIISGSQHNGMRAICPATVSILMNILSQWETCRVLREVALKCCAVMVIVSQRSSPEERQIDLTVIIELYCEVLQKLLDTYNLTEKNGAFEIANDSSNSIIDVNALLCTISNVGVFLSDPKSSSHIIRAISDTQLIDILIDIPSRIKSWNVNQSLLLCGTISSLGVISRKSRDRSHILNKIEKVFKSLREYDAPSRDLLDACFHLTYDDELQIFIIRKALTVLVEWLPDMNESEQTYISALILKGCTSNFTTKTDACSQRTIKYVCESLKKYDKLSEPCICNSIKLIEELMKVTITPIELKRILGLLRPMVGFPHSKKLFQTIVNVSLQNMKNVNVCSQYFDFTQKDDGILVPDIKDWTMSGPYGFIFHCLLKFPNPAYEGLVAANSTQNVDNCNKRRMLLNLRTSSNTGFEVFIQDSGNLVVAALTKCEYLVSSVSTNILFDGLWHYVTILCTPPKRPFSYSQVNVYVDFVQEISTTLKIQAISEPFTFCSVGSSAPHFILKSNPAAALKKSSSHEPSSYKGMLPSLFQRTLSTNVSNYFTLPLRTQTSVDLNVKSFPIGMQDTVFGEQTSLNGQMGAVLLAEPTISLKTIFDAGPNFGSIFSPDNDLLEFTSSFVFCYVPGCHCNAVCQNVIPCGKYPGSIKGKMCRMMKLQDTIGSIGGIQVILPILHRITKECIDFALDSEEDIKTALHEESFKSPSNIGFSEEEFISSNLSTEWKMCQSPIGGFMCLLRSLSHDHENNQENLLHSGCIPIVGMMLEKCHARLFDVNVLKATHSFIESIQAQKIGLGRTELLEELYSEICFNFNIWSKMEFQIEIGHVQYLNAMIRNDRKYFRKKFGVQYFLDVIRKFHGTPAKLSAANAKAIRLALFEIVLFYLQKDVNIKEVSSIITFLASVRHEETVTEFLKIMTSHIKGKNCKDQIILLLHEPQTANLLYNYFVDKSYSIAVQEAAVKFITCLIAASRVHQKYKQVLRLYDQTSDTSMFPGFCFYFTPMTLSPIVLLNLVDDIMCAEPDYAGLVFIVHRISSCDLSIKIEISRRLLQLTFVQQNAPQTISKQVGWQESIARLLIRKPLAKVNYDEERRQSFDINSDVILEDSTEFLSRMELIGVSAHAAIEKMESQQTNDDGLISGDIQATVTETANAIESEIKELADSVSGAVVENVGTVVENVSSVFSILQQTTHDIKDTLESLKFGSSFEIKNPPTKQQADAISSDSYTQSPNIFIKTDKNTGSTLQLNPDDEVDIEEQLVYLVSNILFTIFWRGVSNERPECWRERGQVLGCINLLALNNELMASHLLLRLRILEMAVEACLFDLSEHGSQTLVNQENASQILRMVYDLVVLGSNEDELKKCSTKLLDGVLALFDALMIFQEDSSDDWSDMIRLCLGLLLKCSQHPNAGVVAMATAKLHAILQTRSSENPAELAFLLFSINTALANAIKAGNLDEYSFLTPVMKAVLEKCRNVFNLSLNLPDLPPTSSGPVFFDDFQIYITSKKWCNFVDRTIKPLYDSYQRDVEINLWEPINRFWAECYEACKASSVKRSAIQAEARRNFQEKIVMPWKMRQVEELTRLNTLGIHQKTKNAFIRKKWKIAQRFLYGCRGAWSTGETPEECWSLANRENVARMRLKLEPQLYLKRHENAVNLRDNTAAKVIQDQKIPEFDSTIKNAVVHNYLVDNEYLQLEEELRQSVEAQSQQDVSLEKSVISQDCELITLMDKIKGKIEVNQTFFAFIDLSPLTEEGLKHDFRFSINKIREVHLRKYNLRRSALEIFLVDHTSYFLNFTTKTRNKVFTKLLTLQPPNIQYGSGRSPAELLRTSGITQKWVHREISNFEYLMYLNTVAGRSYNDLSQYPVFPWVLADYVSDVLDLTDPKSFRDLTKPVGVVNPKNEAEVRSKYDSFEDPSGTIPKFHFGTHYSNSGGVLHYLLRVEPFTSLHIELQSGRFDVADRQFHSIPQTWKLLMDNPNDVKELIPEFFYFPEFLKNLNKLDLGYLQITKEKVDDVILPPWATTPEEFIAIHRRALESEYVSQNLHHWIDLIFGYKQKGSKAIDALNVFYYCSYEGAVDLDKIANPAEREAVEGMINNFGQTPSQLLREAHPRRLTHEEITLKFLRGELKRPDFLQFLDRVVQIYCEFSSATDPLVFLGAPRSPPRSFLQLSPDVLASVSKSGVLGCNSWMSTERERGFLLETDATTTNMKNRKRLFGPFHSSQDPHSQMFAVSIDGKLIYAGGIWDNSLRVYNLNKGKLVASITRHSDIVTCLALDNCGYYLVTGSKDCTCMIWSIQTHHSSPGSGNIPVHALAGQAQLHATAQHIMQNSYCPQPYKTLYGHDDAITCVAVYTELDMVVSGSLDGTVNVYTIQEGQFLRTLKPLGCTDCCVKISFVTLSYHGHIAFSVLDDISHSVHVYSVNGVSLGSKYVSGRVTGLTTASEFLVVADDAGDITMSRLNGLKPIFDIPLHIPIQTVVVTPGNTHILAPLRDGRLAVIGVQAAISNNKKHTVLNV